MNSKIKQYTLVSGSTERDMEGESNYGMMAMYTKDIGNKTQVFLKF